MLDGKFRDIGLGAAIGPDAISFAQARDKAIDLRRLVQSGNDALQKHASCVRARIETISIKKILLTME